MKIPPVILLLLITTAVNAQNYPGMNEADMQKLQEMQSCMNNIDQEQLKALEQRQNQFDAEVRALCDSGKRDEAQKKAILFEKEMMKNPAVQAVSKCSEITKGMVPEMTFMNQDENSSNQHVCDSY
ncbi:MAG: hypothetical protein LJE83_10000 [Gammaproteobacteria bacterium]|nr:hypothetical protein [Gammaproteobacteria bacterium]